MKSRVLVPLLLALILVLVGCGGAVTPTPASLPTHAVTSTPAAIATTGAELSSPKTPLPTANADTSRTPSVAPTATAAAPTATTSGGTVEITVLDVGQGDALLIKSPDGRYALIDGGDTNVDAGKLVKQRGIKSLDYVIATHPHADHIGGLPSVLSSVPVETVVTNGQSTTTRTYEKFLDAIADAQSEYREVARGDVLVLGALKLDVLNPQPKLFGGDNGTNENSIVLRLTYGRNAAMLTGDAGKDAEAAMIAAKLPLQATFLKVGHHGSVTSTSSAFLDAVRPTVAVYSAGAGNSYGHPHAETLNTLAKHGVTTYGTDRNGTVTITLGVEDYHVDVAKQSPN